MGNLLRSLYQKRYRSIIVIVVPIALSAFTHIWNPIGYPALHIDESHYMRRAMQVLQGLGPQESNATYDYGYDHPYFGQIFLASVLSLANYPYSINPSIDSHSIEMLYLVPRVLMGILAVIDTFLVYKIADARYNRKVAFISSTLFAILPLSSFLRGIFLDSIALPFILLSILFAIYYAKSKASIDSARFSGNGKNFLFILPSGIFLGVAIFTKLPFFTIIPLIVFILLQKNKTKTENGTGSKSRSTDIRALGVWFLPVVLIPMIWPAYAISVGQFDSWMDGVIYQAARDSGGKDLRSSILYIFELDPVLLIIASAAIIYAVIRKDYFILLWGLPYLVFLYLIGWVVPFHWNILLPLLCIAVGMLIDSLISTMASRKLIKFFPHILISTLVIFGFVTTTRFIESNLNALYFQLYLFMIQELEHHNAGNGKESSSHVDGTTIIGSHRTRALVWIPLYVFKDKITFRETDIPKDNFTAPLKTKKFLIVADSNLLSRLTGTDQYERDARVTRLYYNKSDTIATFIDKDYGKNNLMNIDQNYGFGWFVDVRSNY